METISLTLKEIHDLTLKKLTTYGCKIEHARAVADTITAAEGDGCHSHGLFRLPGYVATLKSEKVNGNATPTLEMLTPSIIKVDGHNCFAPYALQFGRDALVMAARKNGLAAMALVKIHHFSALWVEIEALTAQGLCAIACTAYMPAVLPAGGTKPFYGTNPMAFGWPRKDQPPMVFDQATAAMAKGDIMIAARDKKQLPLGIGVDANGDPTTDPNEVLKGAILPFGGYKGGNLALMIELLVGPLIGERTSIEAGRADNHDGGPPQGGEFILAMDPTQFGNPDPFEHAERLFTALLSQEAQGEQGKIRLPGERRFQNRKKNQNIPVAVAKSLHQKIMEL